MKKLLLILLVTSSIAFSAPIPPSNGGTGFNNDDAYTIALNGALNILQAFTGVIANDADVVHNMGNEDIQGRKNIISDKMSLINNTGDTDFYIQRGLNTANGGIQLGTYGGGFNWKLGIMPITSSSSAEFAIKNLADNSYPLYIDALNRVTITGLNTNQLVATDGSRRLTSVSYTDANTPSTVVSRDSSGNFSANAITATSFNGAVNGSNLTAASVNLTTKVTGILPNANTTATSANTNSAIVARDASGNFSAGNVTTNLLGVGNAPTSPFSLYVKGSGSSTTAGSLAYFGSVTAATAGNIYGACIDKAGYSSLCLGINKNSLTGSIPANGAFMSTFNSFDTMSFGRGQGNGLPGWLDILIGSTGDVTIGNGDLLVATVGKTLFIKSGTNGCAGSNATLIGGTATVNTTCAVTGAIVTLMKTANGGTSANGIPVVGITSGSSFSLTNSGDTSTYSWEIHKTN